MPAPSFCGTIRKMTELFIFVRPKAGPGPCPTGWGLLFSHTPDPQRYEPLRLHTKADDPRKRPFPASAGSTRTRIRPHSDFSARFFGRKILFLGANRYFCNHIHQKSAIRIWRIS